VRVERHQVGGDPARAAGALRRAAGDDPALEQTVRDVVERVRSDGDAAVIDFTRRWDTEGGDPPPLRVEPGELAEALEAAPEELREALKLAAVNVRDVAAAGVLPDRELELPQGQRVIVRETPVRRAGVYVPGGRAAYPSTVIMCAVTARVSGVGQVAVCTPPGRDGQTHPAVLAACALAGVAEVYRMGGAQAVAAFAFGTETVAPVDVVVGPGSPYAQEAKRLLSRRVGIDGYAGPSELLVVVDAGADLGMAALDLRAQAEHGPDSLVAAVATDAAALDGLEAEISGLEGDADAAGLPPLALVEAAGVEEALELVEALAPEHVQLMGAGAEALAPHVRAAGCVFVGHGSGTAFGDYIAGSNHVLPTCGAARFASGLSPRHFRRRVAGVSIPEGPGGHDLARAGAAIARAEGFPFHARSMEERFRDNG
jgi:histidinol dehydrogenase